MATPSYSWNPSAPSGTRPKSSYSGARRSYGLSSPDLQPQSPAGNAPTYNSGTYSKTSPYQQFGQQPPPITGYLPQGTGYQQHYSGQQQSYQPAWATGQVSSKQYDPNNPLSMQKPGYYEQQAPGIVEALKGPSAGSNQLRQTVDALGQPLRGSNQLQGAVSSLGAPSAGSVAMQDTFRAYQRPLAGSQQLQGVFNSLAAGGTGEQAMQRMLGEYRRPLPGTQQMNDVYAGLQGPGFGGQMLAANTAQLGGPGQGGAMLGQSYSDLGQGSPYASGLESVYGRAMGMGPGEGAMGLALQRLSGQSPATQMYQDVYSGFGAPSAGEDMFAQARGGVVDLAGGGNPLAGALDSFRSNRADLATSANLDPYYDRAISKGLEDVDAQAAARGAYGSSAALDQGRELASNLRAEQAGREADYALRRAAEMRGWEGLGGSLAGNLASSQLSALGLGGELAAGADRGRFAGLQGQMGAAGAIGQDALARGSGIADVGSMLAGAERGRLGLASDATTGLMGDVFNRQMGQQSAAQAFAGNELNRLLGQQSGAQAYASNDLARLMGQQQTAQGLASTGLQQLAGQQNAAQGLAASQLNRLLGQGTMAQALQSGGLQQLAGQAGLSQGMASNDLARTMGQIQGSQSLMNTDLQRLLGQGGLAGTMGSQELARLTAALQGAQGVQSMREGRIQQGFENVSGLGGAVGNTVGSQIGNALGFDASLIDALMGTGSQGAQAGLMGAMQNQQMNMGGLNMLLGGLALL